MKAIDPAVAKAIADAPSVGQKQIMAHGAKAGALINGWTFTTNAGHYGNDYLRRALLAAVGLGANLPEDAVYPTSLVDVAGAPYSGGSVT